MANNIERLSFWALNDLAKKANHLEQTEESKIALSDLKKQINLLKADWIDNLQWVNEVRKFRNVIVDILSSDVWLTVVRNDQLSNLNSLLPVWYRLNFSKEADKIQLWDNVKVIVKNWIVLLKRGEEETQIWTIAKWGWTKVVDEKIKKQPENTKITNKSYSIDKDWKIDYSKLNKEQIASLKDIAQKFVNDYLAIKGENKRLTAPRIVNLLRWEKIEMDESTNFRLLANVGDIKNTWYNPNSWDLVLLSGNQVLIYKNDEKWVWKIDDFTSYDVKK